MPIVPSRAKQVQELLSRLGSERAAVRDGAVARLTLLGARAVEPILAALPSAGARSRLAMLEVLARLRDRRALPEILALARGPELEVARKATLLAGDHPLPRTAAALAPLLAEGPGELRGAAASSLARIHAAGVLEAIDPLLDVLLDEDEEDELRLAILDSISTLESRALAPILKRLQGTRCAALARRVSALRPGRAVTTPDTGDLVRKMGRLLSTGPEEGLLAQIAARGRPALELALARLERTRRTAEARRLGRLLERFGEEALPLLHRTLEGSGNLLTVKAVARAVGSLRAPASIPPLHRALERLSSRTAGGEAAAIAETKAQIHMALADLGTRIALYDLREMLAARPPWAAASLLEAAGRIGDASLAPALAALAHDHGPSLEACAAAFGSIARRERLRRTSHALRAVKPEHRAALDALWTGARRR